MPRLKKNSLSSLTEIHGFGTHVTGILTLECAAINGWEIHTITLSMVFYYFAENFGNKIW